MSEHVGCALTQFMAAAGAAAAAAAAVAAAQGKVTLETAAVQENMHLQDLPIYSALIRSLNLQLSAAVRPGNLGSGMKNAAMKRLSGLFKDSASSWISLNLKYVQPAGQPDRKTVSIHRRRDSSSINPSISGQQNKPSWFLQNLSQVKLKLEPEEFWTEQTLRTKKVLS